MTSSSTSHRTTMAFKGLDVWSGIVHGFFLGLFTLLRLAADYLVYPIVKAVKSGRTKPLPCPKQSIVLLSATEISKKIRSREVSCVQVVGAFIEQIKQVDDKLNAVTDERFVAALEDAEKADEEIRSCNGEEQALTELYSRKPFLGLPITTKNALAVKGLGHESGLYLRKGLKSAEDSPAMASMREAGAIPIAVTNTPELCLWIETSNNIFGKTSNPYNQKRTSGGSSGGEGSMLSACGSPFGIGTDIAGSIRVPAAYNGIFGLKPTINTVSIAGHWPMPKDILQPLLIAGPMSKFAEDLRPFLKTLVGGENAKIMKIDEPVDLKKFKVRLIEDFKSSIITAATSEMREATAKAAAHLASLSQSKPVKTHYAGLASAMEIYLAYLGGANCPSYAMELTMLKTELPAGKEMVKYMMNKSEHTFPSLLVANLEKLTKSRKDHPIILKYLNISKELEQQLEKTLTDSIVVCPTLPDIAPYHGLTILRPSILAYTGIWNILGFPAVSIPMGLSKEGMPLGITVVAGKYMDNVCCEVALELERKFGGWVPPFEAETL